MPNNPPAWLQAEPHIVYQLRESDSARVYVFEFVFERTARSEVVGEKTLRWATRRWVV